MSNIEIKLIKDLDLKGHTLIEGFPGIGLIGTIAVGYLSESHDTELIGYVLSDEFPPMASIHKGEPVFPARIYHDKKHKFVILFSEFVVPSKVVHHLADAILGWSQANGIKKIISLAGMTARGLEEEGATIYGIASTKKMQKQLEKHEIQVITEGVTTGVSGILMAKCHMLKIPAMNLLVEATHGYPDPGAAATLLKKLAEMLDIKINTKSLLEEAKNVEQKMKTMFQQMKVGKAKYEQAVEHEPMYG